MFNISDYRDCLGKAFKAMRKAGLVARQNFACCGTCGSHELREIVKEMPLSRQAKVKGIAFYHRQDGDRMRGRDFDGVYIGYGQVGNAGDEDAPNIEVGQIVASCLREAGFTVDWDGDTTKRIFAGIP